MYLKCDLISILIILSSYITYILALQKQQSCKNIVALILQHSLSKSTTICIGAAPEFCGAAPPTSLKTLINGKVGKSRS